MSTTRPPRTRPWTAHDYITRAYERTANVDSMIAKLHEYGYEIRPIEVEAAVPDAELREAAKAVVKAWDKVSGRYDEVLGPAISELKHRLAAHRSSDPSSAPVCWHGFKAPCGYCGAAPAGSAVDVYKVGSDDPE